MDSKDHNKVHQLPIPIFHFSKKVIEKKGVLISQASLEGIKIIAHPFSHRIEKITIRLIFQGQSHIFASRNRDHWISHAKIRPKIKFKEKKLGSVTP